MLKPGESVDGILEALQERAKELTCLYRVHETCNTADAALDEIFRKVVEILPHGWQYPADCAARIEVEGFVIETPGLATTPWAQSAAIRVQGEVVGKVEVLYGKAFPEAGEGPFLKEERKLLDTVAERLGQLLLQRRLLDSLQSLPGVPELSARRPRGEWGFVVEFLRKTDPHLLIRVSRRMINHLCWNGVAAAQDLLPRFAGARPGDEADENRPMARQSLDALGGVADEAFRIAAEHLPSEQIVVLLQKWTRDEKAGFLTETVENQGTSLTEIAEALGRFQNAGLDDRELSRAVQVELHVGLARRILTDDVAFIDAAKDFLEVRDFFDLTRRLVSPPRSYGRLGGKASGLFLAAQILRKSPGYSDLLGDIRIPKTWYVTSDGILNFIEFNELEDLFERKYLEIDQVRREYPHVVQVFKNSRFSPEITKGLSVALDDLGERPIIVRSSSLLEDRVGSAFSGKYKSLFLANLGTKAERLAALMDAIAEVYASVFGPDPIEYRAERGLLDVHEEMGILIQEVVGSRVGEYFLPTFAGVAFSNNEFRWSARIRREDGLVRLVPGLGTRAVDRVGDDYPVLVAPGQPGLRVNVTPEEVARYSSRKADVINLRSRTFETVELADLVACCGQELPGFGDVLSLWEDGQLRRPMLTDWATKPSRFVATFDGLLTETPFLARIRSLLKLLSGATGSPVDIEFASDGRDLYLLQCRAQSFAEEEDPEPIPRDLVPERVVFEARKYVSSGRVPEITHIVYVDPDGYEALPDLASLQRVGRAVGRLNKALPKRRFVLMGPGRWGSRGDVKLGVPVGYSDINNTAVLVEIARKRGGYVPDLSFGTHFFQDLVEASIRYLPLFPDDPDVRFGEEFLKRSPSILSEMAPEYSDLADVVRVLDVPRVSGGLVLRVVMDAGQDRALGFLSPPSAGPHGKIPSDT
jgi:pyruvate,water dikinase